MEGIIILVVTGLALLAGIIFVVVKLVKGPNLPKGHRFEANFGNNKAVIIVDEKLLSQKDLKTNEVNGWIVGGQIIDATDIAKKCAIAMAATETAFKRKGVENAHENMVVFTYRTDETFGDFTSWLKESSSAYTIELSGIFGTKKTPTVVIRARHLKMTANRGQPVIHELVHVLSKAAKGNYSRNHSDPLLWLGPGGIDSAEGIAVAQWADLVEAFKDED